MAFNRAWRIMLGLDLWCSFWSSPMEPLDHVSGQACGVHSGTSATDQDSNMLKASQIFSPTFRMMRKTMYFKVLFCIFYYCHSIKILCYCSFLSPYILTIWSSDKLGSDGLFSSGNEAPSTGTSEIAGRGCALIPKNRDCSVATPLLKDPFGLYFLVTYLV